MLFRFLEKTIFPFIKTKRDRRRSRLRDIKVLPSGIDRSQTRIMVFGDSNSFRPDGNGKSWPSLLQAKEPFRLRVFNESCDGRTIDRDTGDRKGIAVIRDKLLLHSPLDYLIVMLGTNDLKKQYGPLNPFKIVSSMRKLLTLVESFGIDAKPILLTPPPIGILKAGQLAGGHLRIETLATAYRKLAMHRAILLVDIYSAVHVHTSLEFDKVHLNAFGRQRVADAVLTTIRAQLRLEN